MCAAYNYDDYLRRHYERIDIFPCANCEEYSDNTVMIFDEYTERYFCDKHCYEEWASDNHELVTEYYYRMNVE